MLLECLKYISHCEGQTYIRKVLYLQRLSFVALLGIRLQSLIRSFVVKHVNKLDVDPPQIPERQSLRCDLHYWGLHGTEGVASGTLSLGSNCIYLFPRTGWLDVECRSSGLHDYSRYEGPIEAGSGSSSMFRTPCWCLKSQGAATGLSTSTIKVFPSKSIPNNFTTLDKPGVSVTLFFL
jgi:hypothetical protein